MLAALGFLLAAAGPGCAKGPGTVVVVGTGEDSYYVADRTGDRDLTGFRRTNAAVELPAGPYVVRLNGTRADVRIRAGARVEVSAGVLLVAGSGADSYFVADSAGDRDLTGFRRTASPLELLPGSYVVRLNGSRADARIAAGQRTEIAAGSLVVSGSGEDSYYVADAAEEHDLTGFRRTGTPLELLPGTYVVRLGERRLPIEIRPGVQTTASPQADAEPGQGL